MTRKPRRKQPKVKPKTRSKAKPQPKESPKVTTKEKYSPENYLALGVDDYRVRFPEETKNISDEVLFNAVMDTDDDLDDADWRGIFIALSAIAA